MMSSAHRHNPVRDAFTLIELMISIALVLLLMLGINQVFKVTGQAIGTNQAISTGVRDGRAVQSVMATDLGTAAPKSPAIIIRSERVSAFRNRQDQLQDRDWAGGPSEEATKRTIDIDGDGLEGEAGVLGEIIAPAVYNFRSHRIDSMSFFGTGLFRRQTGGALPTPPNPVYLDEYISDMSTSDAWIWYGHLRRPDERSPVTPPSNQMYEHRDPGANPNPAAGDYNDRNFVASDFVLGRIAILLTEGTDTLVPLDGVGDEIRDGPAPTGILQRFIARTVAVDNVATNQTDTLAPLKVGTQSNDPPGAPPQGPWEIQWSRYDLANTSIRQFTTILKNYRNAWDAAVVTEPWYDGLGIWRFQGDPTPLRPLTTSNASRTTPVLLPNCSQFMVEYAGDFLAQDPITGALDPADPYRSDGTIDFLIDNSVTGAPVRRIRWYGMPRDVAGNATTGGPDGIILGGAGATDPNDLVDVVPLRDVLGMGFVYTPPAGAPTNLFVERLWPELTPGTRLGVGSPIPPAPGFYANGSGGGASLHNGAYVVAWGPDTNDQPRPKMIRVVVTIDDPDGRIAEGQTFEYVFRIGG
jgi:prepilin-type N-terminal cleavage/methylation domain-containing protein